MEMDYMEGLARAYRESLAAKGYSSDIDEAISIVTKQLGAIADISAKVMPKNSALGYLQTLKMVTYTSLIALLPKEKTPAPYLGERGLRMGYNFLINTQVELFYVLDRIKASGVSIDAIEQTEAKAFTAMVAMKG